MKVKTLVIFFSILLTDNFACAAIKAGMMVEKIEKMLEDGYARDEIIGSLDLTIDNEWTALDMAVNKDKQNVVEILLSVDNVHDFLFHRNSDRKSPLHIAAGNGNIPLIRKILLAADSRASELLFFCTFDSPLAYEFFSKGKYTEYWQAKSEHHEESAARWYARWCHQHDAASYLKKAEDTFNTCGNGELLKFLEQPF